MGCHTLFKRVSNKQFTFEEVKDNCIRYLQREIELSNVAIDGIMNNVYSEDKWWGGNLNIDTYKNGITYAERVIHFINKGYIKDALYTSEWVYDMNKEEIVGIGHGVFYNKTYYLCDENMPRDIFRVGHYPEDVLYNILDADIFIKNYEEKYNKECKSYWENRERVIKFFIDFLNGIICFG